MAKKNVYERLGTTESDFTEIVRSVLLPLPSEYHRPIAERISHAVAVDVEETADIERWSMGDVELGVGRVLCKRLGIMI